MRVSDIALQLFFGNERRDRIDDDNVDRVGFDEHFGDTHGLFAAGRLADQKGFEVDAQALRPARIERVFGVDEGGDSAGFLGLGDDMKRQGCLAARLGSEDFDDSSFRDSAPAQSDIE